MFAPQTFTYVSRESNETSGRWAVVETEETRRRVDGRTDGRHASAPAEQNRPDQMASGMLGRPGKQANGLGRSKWEGK